MDAGQVLEKSRRKGIIPKMKDLEGKNVLVVGLGTLGGGASTVKWLLGEGAILTVTDLRTRRELKDSILGLGARAKKVRWVLGGHRMEDFGSHDLVVVGPGVKIRGNKYLAAAKRKKIPLANDLTLFLERVQNPVIAVTGTRGKTTTVNWVAHLLKDRFPGVKASGNSSEDALLKLLPRLEGKGKVPAVLELSSFQLELAENAERGPDIAVITNVFRDHMNRHGNMREYARVKANIFKKQRKDQNLILNFDNRWTQFFLELGPRARKYFVSSRKLPGKCRGLGGAKFLENGKEKNVLSEELINKIRKLGGHNVENFFAAALAAHLMGVSWEDIEKRGKGLPQIKFREEPVLRKRGLVIINDTTATSPEGSMAAAERFKGKETIFIAGGTDKGLEYKEWAKCIEKHILPQNLFFLEGSATKKMIRELNRIGYFKKKRMQVFGDLKRLLKEVSAKKRNTIVFSPGAASFEKFKNEFDRGEKFNVYSKQIFDRSRR